MLSLPVLSRAEGSKHEKAFFSNLLDIISEMRYASLFLRIVDRKFSDSRAAAVFNGATVWGAKALGRDDLG